MRYHWQLYILFKVEKKITTAPIHSNIVIWSQSIDMRRRTILRRNNRRLKLDVSPENGLQREKSNN